MMVLFADADQFMDIDSAMKQFDVLHQPFGSIFGVQHAKLGKHAHVGTFVTQASLYK